MIPSSSFFEFFWVIVDFCAYLNVGFFAFVAMEVVGCNRLKDTEWLSRQDPYVRLEYGSTKYRTRTCTGNFSLSTFQIHIYIHSYVCILGSFIWVFGSKLNFRKIL